MARVSVSAKTIARILRALIGDAEVPLAGLRRSGWYVRSALTYRRLQKLDESGRFPLHAHYLYPCVGDAEGVAGRLGHYFFQDLWAAAKIYSRRPAKHTDIGSRIDGFVAHLLVFMNVEIVDIRPIHTHIKGLTFIQDDASYLNRIPSQSIDSLSSLHAVEHFGLGRYGDPIDPSAWARAIANMKRVLKPGGRTYFSVPVGAERLEFNAHRIFSPQTILEEFSDLDLVEFSAVDDKGTFHCGADWRNYTNARHACGLFEFLKPWHT